MSFAVVCMLGAAFTLYVEEHVLTVFAFVFLCVMVVKRAASDSIRVCAAQSWDYLSQGRVSTAALPAPWHKQRRVLISIPQNPLSPLSGASSI